jgi:hypothetical protein
MNEKQYIDCNKCYKFQSRGINMGIIASSLTMLFVVLFKARYIYLDEEDDTKGSKKRSSRKIRQKN